MTKICDKEDGFACPMDLISVFGEPDDESKYDLYQCKRCGMLMKYQFLDNNTVSLRTVIKNDNTIIREV
jgi:hypothetical protein